MRLGDDRLRVTFCIGTLRYEGSTLCSEPDLALMVARAVYAELKERAGRLAASDPRRRTRGVLHVGVVFFTHRPKRAVCPARPETTR